MKKLITLLLTLAMVVTAIPATAFAANNGPVDYSPAMGIYLSNIFFGKIDANGDDEYAPSEDGLVPVGDYIYKDAVVNNTAINGVTYDKASNTLTLNNFNDPDRYIICGAMGDDFKIKVIGNCATDRITLFAEDYGNSITFTGNGTISINSKKRSEYGLILNANYAASKVNFDYNVNVNIYGSVGAAYIDFSAIKNPSDAFTFKGTHTAQFKTEDIYNDSNMAEGIYFDRDPQPDYIGIQGKRLSDPDGL